MSKAIVAVLTGTISALVTGSAATQLIEILYILISNNLHKICKLTFNLFWPKPNLYLWIPSWMCCCSVMIIFKTEQLCKSFLSRCQYKIETCICKCAFSSLRSSTGVFRSGTWQCDRLLGSSSRMKAIAWSLQPLGPGPGCPWKELHYWSTFADYNGYHSFRDMEDKSSAYQSLL